MGLTGVFYLIFFFAFSIWGFGSYRGSRFMYGFARKTNEKRCLSTMLFPALLEQMLLPVTFDRLFQLLASINTNPRQDKTGPDSSTSMQRRLGPRIRSSACWRCSTSL
jgi:hypothetical protein